MEIKFNENMPIYIQIMDGIKREIVMGGLKEGDKLSSVREMAELLKVNPNTVQRAYQELERENITNTQRGMGTFVTTDGNKISEVKKEISKEIIQCFIKDMKDFGYKDNEIVTIVKEYISGEVL